MRLEPTSGVSFAIYCDCGAKSATMFTNSIGWFSRWWSITQTAWHWCREHRHPGRPITVIDIDIPKRAQWR